VLQPAKKALQNSRHGVKAENLEQGRVVSGKTTVYCGAEGTGSAGAMG
jgi:hypothetical protein